MKHGNVNEDKTSIRYLWEKKDVGFQFGLIPHWDLKWSFLGVSPDLIVLKGNRAVEIKNPYKRKMLWIKPDIISECKKSGSVDWYCFKLLHREVSISGDCHKYLTITNLSPRFSGILQRQVYYWHQCQLQAEVLHLGDQIDYVQHGTSPNHNYLDHDLLLITSLDVDKSWLSTYGEQLRKTWEEIQYYKDPKVPIPMKKSESSKYIYPGEIISETPLKRKYDIESLQVIEKWKPKRQKPLLLHSEFDDFSQTEEECPL